MDWGLLDKNAGDNFLLREQIVYDSKVGFIEFFSDDAIRIYFLKFSNLYQIA